ncbi:hypothetical protein CCOS865_04168 [Pseudomonas reidholzensis]|uniref:Iron-containing redox enzyme family protein n=1 Tax=Pseudomonas reidholzensis TaxID=1785162 RepID=A0A383RZQ9_9PSED|nr:iron-containing redox enzyme family protein [Pseudomonas reidholzensis]SYX91888.1 hypothetical protein CCOS865_04168 [Pseudomonas reidholzensis]
MMVMTQASAHALRPPLHSPSLEQRYRTWLDGDDGQSAAWLAEQLQAAERLPDDLPDHPGQLFAWSAQRAGEVAQAYADYLRQRREGGPRQYFANRAQALWYLQQVAPTKAVDGVWLHGTLRQWRDPRYHGLIRTYLEELGDGDARCNHVLIYQRLLSRVGCLESIPLDPERYLQGSVQLALGLNSDSFLGEVLGYNLGYEQPPLHLLITTYELAELGIDGHYFQLHVTIDNAASGHAHRSIQAIVQLCPEREQEAFYARVRRGYRLNDLGTPAAQLIASFGLEAELLAALERKRGFGQFMHSDHCKLQGRTINQWLAEPMGASGFIQALQTQGWLRRHEDPAKSRFWTLIDGPSAAMFGVFSAYEKQLWHDWIAGEWQAPKPRRVFPGSWDANLAEAAQALQVAPQTAVEALIERMAGNRHALPEGLLATRAYAQATGLLQAGVH